MTAVPRTSPLWRLRVVGLVLLAASCFRIGIAYSPFTTGPVTLPAALQIITAPLPGPTTAWQPIWLFGIAWFVNGLAAVFVLMWGLRRPIAFNLTYIFAATGMFYWGAAYLVAQIKGEDHRSWFSAASYFIAFGFIALVGHSSRPKRPKAQLPDEPELGSGT